MPDYALSACKRKVIKGFSVFDIESKKGSWEKFDFAGFYDGAEYSRHDSVESLVDKLMSSKVPVYAHFLDYDGMFILDYALKNSDLSVVPIISNLIISMRLSRNGQEAELNNSFMILPFSLKHLLKAFDVGIEKESLKNIEKRNWGDCVGLYRILEKFFAHDDTYALTTASRGMVNFRSRFLKRKIFDNPSLDVLARKAYYGGRTEIFKFNLDIEKKFYLYDINSLYPSCMKGKIFPLGVMAKVNPSKLDDVEGFGLIEFNDQRKIPLLPVRKSGKLYFPKGFQEGAYTIPEIRELRDYDIEFKIKVLFGTEDYGTIFDEYVDFYFKEKQEAEIEGNFVKRMNAKLMLNSLYGKLAQRQERRNIIFNPSEFHSGFIPLKDDFSIVAYRENSKSTFMKPILSAYITDYSRLTMRRLINEGNEKYIYYMDTDSIYADKKIFNDSHELGKMKLENEVRGMLFFAPKFYFYHGGIKCKGVKVYDTDEDGNKKMNYDRVMDYAMGKKISYSGGLKKIRSSIPAEVFLSENEITRSYKHFYDKREIRGLDTFPIERMPFDNSRQYRAILSEMQGILQKNRDLYFQSNS